ncbi:hypothetical protein HDU79_011378 [Rhizoclosmatium sp. JEL0117]|nr:hypothetical protein HDU79_011378 [Rhizoclosmatium sp. JEL0117]
MMKKYEPSLEKSDDRNVAKNKEKSKLEAQEGWKVVYSNLLQYSTLEFIVIPVYIRGADSLLLYNYESKRFEWITLTNKNVGLAIQALQEKTLVPGEIEIVDVSKLQTLLDTYSAYNPKWKGTYSVFNPVWIMWYAYIRLQNQVYTRDEIHDKIYKFIQEEGVSAAHRFIDYVLGDYYMSQEEDDDFSADHTKYKMGE